MAHSIELLFDLDTEAAIRCIWDELAAAWLPSQAAVTSPTNRPHVTLAVADRVSAAVDGLLVPLAQRLPAPCLVGATLLLGSPKPVLARLVVPSAELVLLHAEATLLCLPHLVGGPMPNTLPGHWTPHATVARGLEPEQLAEAFAIAGAGGDIEGQFVGLRRWDSDSRVDHLIG